jgi:hypothetical protein
MLLQHHEQRNKKQRKSGLSSFVNVLPQLVLGHVSTQDATTEMPLSTRDAGGGEAARDGAPAWGLEHANFVAAAFVGVGRTGKEEDAGECQRRSEDPDEIPHLLHDRRDDLQPIRAHPEAPIHSASLLPTFRAALIDPIRDKGGSVHPPHPTKDMIHDAAAVELMSFLYLALCCPSHAQQMRLMSLLYPSISSSDL